MSNVVTGSTYLFIGGEHDGEWHFVAHRMGERPPDHWRLADRRYVSRAELGPSPEALAIDDGISVYHRDHVVQRPHNSSQAYTDYVYVSEDLRGHWLVHLITGYRRPATRRLL